LRAAWHYREDTLKRGESPQQRGIGEIPGVISKATHRITPPVDRTKTRSLENWKSKSYWPAGKKGIQRKLNKQVIADGGRRKTQSIRYVPRLETRLSEYC